jgi:hypothetical protein
MARTMSTEVFVMDVLVVESDPGAAAGAIAELTAAGHVVHRCHEPGAPAFPCAAIESGRCPLEREPIDVALTVRTRAGSQPWPLEDGLVCALRRHVPVVVSGRALHPFQRYGVTAAGRDVVGACERAANGPQAGHEAIATKTLDETLGRAGVAADESGVRVLRRDGRLEVTIAVPAGTDAKVRELASVRVTGALRAFDHAAAGIDVSCLETGA